MALVLNLWFSNTLQWFFWSISCAIAFTLMAQDPKEDPKDDISTLVQVVACYHQPRSHCLKQYYLRSMRPYGITWPQSKIQKYLFPYGSLGVMGHDPYGPQSIENSRSHHWSFYSLENVRWVPRMQVGISWVPFFSWNEYMTQDKAD